MTPPNACINSGAETTAVSAEGSQTYEADFSVGALKPGYIPNRMMASSSLPVGSTQWHLVVQEALNLGGQAASQSVQLDVVEISQPATVQYLTLAVQTASPAPVAPIADVENAAVVNAVHIQADSEPEVTAQTEIVASLAADAPIAVADVADDVHLQADDELEVIAHTAVAPSLASDAPVAGAAQERITQTMVAPIVQEAIERWESAGLEQEALNKMRNTTFVVSDLPELYLGMVQDGTVWIDWDAAGRGWFVDSTPDDDDEFDSAVTGNALQAVDPQALDRIDLLTVVEHELGHIAGLMDSDISGLMGPSLESGLRLIPSAHDAALANV